MSLQDLATIQNSIHGHREGIKARLAINRDAVLKGLREIGATHAVISYCGSGDSGAIEHVDIFQGEANIEPAGSLMLLEPHSVFNARQNGWNEQLKMKLMELGDAIEFLVYDWLEFEHGGWVNNDGASGECRIDVCAGTLTLGHNAYYTDSEFTEHKL